MAESYQPAANSPRELDGNRTTNPKSNPGKSLLAVILAVCALGALLIIGILPRIRQNHTNDERAHAAATDSPPVYVTKPKPAQDDALVFPGSTQAITDAQVGARTTGYVTKRYVDIGAHVHKGQVLAEIESPDVDQQLSQANAQVAQSKATVAQSQADVANKQSTVAQYRSNVRQAQANLESSRAQLADAQAKLAQLEAAEKTAEAQREQAVQAIDVKRAVLNQANTQRQFTQVTYERYQTLLKAGYVALQDVDQNRANFENAQAAVNSAQADVNASTKAAEAAASLVRSAQANVGSGRAQVRAAQKNVAAVAATVNAAQSTVNAAQANVRSSESNVSANRFAQQASQANSKRFEVLTSFEKVVAPFDGVITARNVEVGSLVNAGNGGTSGGSGNTSTTSAANAGSASSSSSASGLFGIARTDELRILVSVPQAYSSIVRPGMVAHITIREFPGQKFDGKITNVAGALDAVSRTLLTEIHLPNPNGKLLPGLYAQVAFDLAKTQGGLRVPATSVIFDAQGTRVALVDAQNKLHFVQVHLSRDFNTEVELDEGIKATDTVVVNPSDDLKEGQSVKPTAPPAPPAAPGGAPEKPAGTPPPKPKN